MKGSLKRRSQKPGAGIKKSESRNQSTNFLTTTCCLPPSSFNRFSFWFLNSCFCILFLSACSSEILRQQEKLIQAQQAEISKQRKEIEELEAAAKKEEQKRRDCNRAFRYFEQGQKASNSPEAVVLYRKGLDLCPDDDVARYELGKILSEMGEIEEASREFDAVLRVNPNFQDARRQLKALGR